MVWEPFGLKTVAPGTTPDGSLADGVSHPFGVPVRLPAPFDLVLDTTQLK